MSAVQDRFAQALARTDIIIPIYNERETVAELLRRLRASCPGAHLIFVDNASTDGTRELLEAELGIRLVCHERNLGYGTSLVDGIRAGDREFVIMIDADLEYRPEDAPAVAEALERFDAVYGSRFLGRAVDDPEMAWRRSRGNWTVTRLFNLVYGRRLTDVYTGLRGYRRAVLDPDAYRRPGFDFILELSALVALRGARFGEVPVEYHLRSTGASEMKHLREFVKFLYWVVRHRFRG